MLLNMCDHLQFLNSALNLYISFDLFKLQALLQLLLYLLHNPYLYDTCIMFGIISISHYVMLSILFCVKYDKILFFSLTCYNYIVMAYLFKKTLVLLQYSPQILWCAMLLGTTNHTLSTKSH